LVFEDTDDDFDRLQKALADAGYHAVRAKTREEFNAQTPYERFAYIIIDLFLGVGPSAEKVGIDLTRVAKIASPGVPVVVASDLEPGRNDVAESFRAGASDYVDKKDLLNDVRGCLERARGTVKSEEREEEEEFPLPMAFLLRSLRRSQMAPRRRLERMVELFEVTLKLVAYSLLSAHRGRLATLLPKDLTTSLLRPSLGHFTQVTAALPDAPSFVAALSITARRPRFRQICDEFITLRNEYIGHGVSQPDPVYERLVREKEPVLKELLRTLRVFRKWTLVWPATAGHLTKGYEYEVKVFRGSNPEPTVDTVKTECELRPTKHVHFFNEGFSEALDLHPWCQFLVCEQRCLSEKLFFYRMFREGEIWALDHVYGHALQTRSGCRELREELGFDQ
jgi:DNA-binding response OmpR family regulator